MSSDAAKRHDLRTVLRGFTPQALRDAREHRGMSRADLARLAQIKTVETIRRWELGLSQPQIDVLGRAITCLDIPADTVIVTDPESRYLSDWRHLQLLTQPALAAAAGLQTTLVHQLETGLGSLTDERAGRLAEVLRITPSEVRAAYERAQNRPAGTRA